MDSDFADGAEYDETYVESTLGWGGMVVGPDGVGHPIPEHEALAAAIPLWVDLPEHLDQAVHIYAEAAGRPEAPVRLAAVTAIGEVARRYGRLPHRSPAREALRRALGDLNGEVRAAAATALALVDATPD